ncbi:MAG TPA: PAS domain-containing protein [Actinomycetota bacterium]|nr:PAS domain-containing protein [Actinomycetota bacterium]
MKQWELAGVTIDVSGRGRVIEAPARPPDSFRVLVDQCPALIWTTDSSLVFTSSLGGGLAALGIGPNQLVGVSLLELVNDDAPDPKPLAAHQRALHGETVTFEMLWGDRIFQARVGPLHDGRGVRIGTVCVALDTTEASLHMRAGRVLGLATTA